MLSSCIKNFPDLPINGLQSCTSVCREQDCWDHLQLAFSLQFQFRLESREFGLVLRLTLCAHWGAWERQCALQKRPVDQTHRHVFWRGLLNSLNCLWHQSKLKPIKQTHQLYHSSKNNLPLLCPPTSSPAFLCETCGLVAKIRGKTPVGPPAGSVTLGK